MKKKMKIGIVLMVVLSLIVSMTACGSTKEETAQASSKDSSEPAVTKAEASAEKAKEPVTLSIYGRAFAFSFPSGEQNDPVAKEIERVTGVKISIESQPDDQKLGALLASGDLPDILYIDPKKDKVNQLITGDNVVDMEPLLATNGQDIAKNFDKQIRFMKKYFSNDTGKLYFLPGQVDNGAFSYIVTPWIRWDYYKEMNYPEVKDENQLLDVLAKMQKAHPSTDDGKKVYGISQWFDWGLWGYTTFAGGIYGLNTQNLMDVKLDNYEASSIILNDESSLWKGVRFFNKANRLGILDPESFTQKYDMALQKIQSNRALVSLVSWPVITPNQEFQKVGQLKGYQPIPPTPDRQAYYCNNKSPMTGNNIISITKNCKTPDRAMDFLAYIMSEEGSRTLSDGVKGQVWVEENGKAKMTPDGLKGKLTDSEFAIKTGAGKYGNYQGINGNAKGPSGQYIDLMLEPDVVIANLTNLEKEWCSYYGVSYPNEVLEKNVKYPYWDTTIGSFIPNTPDDIKRIDDKITTYLTTNLPKCVLAKTDADYEAAKKKIVEDVKKMDLDKSVTYWSKVWADAKAKYQEFSN